MKQFLIFVFTLTCFTAAAQNNVGIGTVSPTDQLHTTGTVRFQNYTGIGTRLMYVDSSGHLTTPVGTISNNNTIQAIPDNGCSTNTGISSSITVSGLAASVASSKIAVRLNITHTFDGDLFIFLVAPNGAVLRLVGGAGGNGDNFTGTILSDDAATSVQSGTAPFTDRYIPTGAIATACLITTTVPSFSAIGGGTVNPNGTWTLKIFDNAGSDVGTLDSWQITFDGQIGFGTSGATGPVPYFNGGNLAFSNITNTTAGNVGIGNAAPTEKLEVNGNVQIPAAGKFQYVTPKTLTQFISPYAFINSGTTTGSSIYDILANETYLNGNGSSTIGYMLAPLNLPTGATLTGVTFYVVDASTTKSVDCRLYTNTIGSTGVTLSALAGSAIAFSSSTPTTVSLTVPSNLVIDNATTSYFLRVTLGNDVTPVSALTGVVVTYTVKNVD